MQAAIDAGSNTLRLMVGEVVQGKVVPHIYHRRITRLAGGFTEADGLSRAARERTLAAFLEFSTTCHKLGVKDIRAVGTAAFRHADNGQDFSRSIESATGINLKIISGEQEAALTASGVLSVLEPMPERSLIVDIGGGSTEFILCERQNVLWSKSIDMGVVRLTEGFADQKQRMNSIKTSINKVTGTLSLACDSAGIHMSTLSLVGTAGTVTTLAALDMQMADYDWRKVNNYSLSASRLQEWRATLEPLDVSQREALPGMEAGRGDLIMSGIEIILCLMKKLKSDSLSISDFGILEGLLLSPDVYEKT